MVRLLALLLLVSFNVGAANNDDGFVWIDANTKIKLKPIGSASAAAGATAPEKAPEQSKKAKKKEKTPK
jgi:hypothetical protein